MRQRRYSWQRELIYDYVQASSQHPTAAAVYQDLKKGCPRLSLATVYRNLTILTSEGRIRRLPLSVERYDARLSPHSHFCCTACGRVFDLVLAGEGVLEAEAQAASGFQIEGHELTFYGRCNDCAAKQKETEK